jgi:hypothetical protein
MPPNLCCAAATFYVDALRRGGGPVNCALHDRNRTFPTVVTESQYATIQTIAVLFCNRIWHGIYSGADTCSLACPASRE